MKLAGKVAVISGGGSGIGRATAKLFAREGAKVAVLDLNLDGAQETVDQINSHGKDAMPLCCNVADSRQVSRAIDAIINTYGALHVVFNNAAFNRTRPPIPEDIISISVEHWNNVIAVNLSGMLHLCKFSVPHLLESKGGTIINVSSSLALASAPNCTAYSSSKSGVIGLTKSLALDLGHAGIRVNAICPGAIDTPRLNLGFERTQLKDFAKRLPLQRIGRPEDIANAALFLASGDAAYITGAVLAVDGGQSAKLAF